MLRTAEYLSQRIGRIVVADDMRPGLFLIHLAVIVYVSVGWLLPWRAALYFYALLLPMIALQWLVNGGSSIVNNVENLVHSGRWSDAENRFEGAFFKVFFDAAGIPATQAQITTGLCFLMLILWIAAICRMMLIVTVA